MSHYLLSQCNLKWWLIASGCRRKGDRVGGRPDWSPQASGALRTQLMRLVSISRIGTVFNGLARISRLLKRRKQQMPRRPSSAEMTSIFKSEFRITTSYSAIQLFSSLGSCRFSDHRVGDKCGAPAIESALRDGDMIAQRFSVC